MGPWRKRRSRRLLGGTLLALAGDTTSSAATELRNLGDLMEAQPFKQSGVELKVDQDRPGLKGIDSDICDMFTCESSQFRGKPWFNHDVAPSANKAVALFAGNLLVWKVEEAWSKNRKGVVGQCLDEHPRGLNGTSVCFS